MKKKEFAKKITQMHANLWNEVQENKIINDFLSTSFARFTSTFHTLLQILFSIEQIIDESSFIKMNKYSNY